ncbi:MAG: 4-hydroxy-tetrahydrodipicolinate synthase [Thiothrix sp.]|nr:4-hydroxy-tetrahydrodipicolinate synthase [Thiothrix sp.]HPE62069.1 4-hydroxy-tetrahydrodipicolinate synthase [Thiolinea sp.]
MFHGSMVALITPMNPDGTIDEQGLEALVAFHMENGTDAIVAVGTTGESPTLSYQEHRHVVKRIIELVGGRLPVIAGTGSNSTAEAIEMTRWAREDGADAALLVAPYYNKPTQEGLYRHYQAIAEAVAIPQILYNVPGRTVSDILPETVERLSHIANIVGIKEASGNVMRAREIAGRCGERLELYSGEDITTLAVMLEAGGKGTISVTANVAPKLMHEMCAAALAGDTGRATALNERLVPLHKALFLEPNPTPTKWALHRMGYCGDGIRLPLLPLSEALQPRVREAMQHAGITIN